MTKEIRNLKRYIVGCQIQCRQTFIYVFYCDMEFILRMTKVTAHLLDLAVVEDFQIQEPPSSLLPLQVQSTRRCRWMMLSIFSQRCSDLSVNPLQVCACPLQNSKGMADDWYGPGIDGRYLATSIEELCVVESVKSLLIERCQQAWEKINRLNEVRFKLNLDINDKHEALEIDKDQLTLDKNCANISLKTDACRIVKNSLPYETWLEHTKYTKLLADNELADTLRLREALFVVRERARNDLLAQRDRVDFTLRKRIYETQKARNEIEWQDLKMRDEMEKVQAEIRTLIDALNAKQDALKLAETRLENRSYRPGFELARDEAEQGLKDEVEQLRHTFQELTNKINCTKATYNALEDQEVAIQRDLANKSQSLMTDIRCLDLRVRLREGQFAGPTTETDRNIQLTHMEDEIPPT